MLAGTAFVYTAAAALQEGQIKKATKNHSVPGGEEAESRSPGELLVWALAPGTSPRQLEEPGSTFTRKRALPPGVVGGATGRPAPPGQSQLSASGQEAAAGPSGRGARFGTHARSPGVPGGAGRGGRQGRGLASALGAGASRGEEGGGGPRLREGAETRRRARAGKRGREEGRGRGGGRALFWRSGARGWAPEVEREGGASPVQLPGKARRDPAPVAAPSGSMHRG